MSERADNLVEETLHILQEEAAQWRKLRETFAHRTHWFRAAGQATLITAVSVLIGWSFGLPLENALRLAVGAWIGLFLAAGFASWLASTGVQSTAHSLVSSLERASDQVERMRRRP